MRKKKRSPYLRVKPRPVRVFTPKPVNCYNCPINWDCEKYWEEGLVDCRTYPRMLLDKAAEEPSDYPAQNFFGEDEDDLNDWIPEFDT